MSILSRRASYPEDHMLTINPDNYPTPQERYDRLWADIQEHPKFDAEEFKRDPVEHLKRIASGNKAMEDELLEFGLIGSPVRLLQWKYWRTGEMRGPWPPGK